ANDLQNTVSSAKRWNVFVLDPPARDFGRAIYLALRLFLRLNKSAFIEELVERREAGRERSLRAVRHFMKEALELVRQEEDVSLVEKPNPLARDRPVIAIPTARAGLIRRLAAFDVFEENALRSEAVENIEPRKVATGFSPDVSLLVSSPRR